MLRILVISLFVANLLLLAFQGSKPAVEPETRVTQTVVKDTGIPTIHLFSEILQDQGLLADNRQCFSLGPFHSSEEMDETRARLLEVSTRISERQTQALVEKGYWVFMPPYTSMLEANEELLSLQARGFEDISIVYSGDWKNAISLGYFMRQENAARHKKALEDKGYEPLMRVQRQSEPRYWLDYEQTPGSGLIALDMKNRPNDFMQRALPCPEEDLFEITGADAQEPAEDLAQLQVSGREDNPVPAGVEDVEVAQPVESPPQKAEDMMQHKASEQENGLSPKQAEDMDAAVLSGGALEEAEDLVQQQIPEQDNDLTQDPVEELDTTVLIEGGLQEVENLTQPQTPEPENNESPDSGEDLDAAENPDGPPQ